MKKSIFHLVTGTALAVALSASSAYAQKKYDTGATDTEIKIGQTIPTAARPRPTAWSGKAAGGLHQDDQRDGRREWPQDQSDPASTTATRPPRPSSRCAAGRAGRGAPSPSTALGTPTNAAMRKYLNDNKVPQLFVASGAAKFTRPPALSVDDGLHPELFGEARIYGQDIVSDHSRTRRSVSSIRTTTSVRTIRSASRTASAPTRRPR